MNLQPDQLVHTSAHGLRPGAVYGIELCDYIDAFFDDGCAPGLGIVTADAAGRASADVKLPGYLLHYEFTGPGYPVYCRDDTCRVYYVTQDDNGNQVVATGRKLTFAGSTATINLSSATDLPRRERVRVTGTAYGAEGRQVAITERVCAGDVKNQTCDPPTRPLVHATVDPTGHFATTYVVRRYIPAAFAQPREDCANSRFETACVVVLTVLDEHGHPDYSFGDPDDWGQPGVILDFSTAK